MKTITRFVFSVAVLLPLSIVVCSGRKDKGVSFSFSDFETRTIKIDQVKFSPIVLDAISSTVKKLDKSVLILAPRSSDYLVLQCDFETGTTKKLVHRGRGPRELLGVAEVHVSDDAVYFYDVNSRKVLQYYRFPGDSLSFHSEISLEDNFVRILPDSRGGFLGFPMNKGRFSSISSRGITERTFGSFPPIKGPKEAVNNSALASHAVFSPDGSTMCSVFRRMDCIEFYNKNYSLIKRLYGPEHRIPEVSVKRVSVGVMYVASPLYFSFSGACAAGGGVIMGYIGDEMKSPDDPERGIKTLLSFDWAGNCKVRYNLPFELVNFDVDSENWVTGVTLDYEHPQIVRFPLPDR